MEDHYIEMISKNSSSKS